MAQTQAQLVDFGTSLASSVPTNGLYLAAANTTAISANGVGRLFVNGSAGVGINTSTLSVPLTVQSDSGQASIRIVGRSVDNTSYAEFTNSAQAVTYGFFRSGPTYLAAGIGATEALRVDSSGRLLVGTSSARSTVFSDKSPQLQVEGTSAATAMNSIVLNTNNTEGAYFVLAKTRGTSVGSNTIVQNGDGCGRISFQGADGSKFIECAAIDAAVDGTPGANDMPGRLVFSTTADGASYPTERMRISQNGVVKITGVAGSLNPDFQLEAPGVIGAGLFIDRTNSRFYAWCGGPQTTGVYLTNAGTSWISTSDERQKTDLQPITDGLGKIGQLRSVTGRFITDEESTRRSFLIAQDVQAVLPEAIDATNPDSLGVSYTDVIPLLVAALKEAKERIETLEAEVTALKAQ